MYHLNKIFSICFNFAVFVITITGKKKNVEESAPPKDKPASQTALQQPTQQGMQIFNF